MAVVFYRGLFGGAAKRNRWAALSPKYGCRTDPVARHHRASSGVIRHRPGIVRASSGHIRVRNDHRVPYRLSPVTSSRRARRVRYDLSPDRVPSGVSRAVSPVARSRPIALVACRIARRRTRRRGWVSCALWPGAGLRAVAPVARSRLVISRPVSATSVSVPSLRSGAPNARHLPCPGPTVACRRRRQPLCANVYSFVVPWRFMMARSAARLRRGVGPLSHHGSCRTNEPMTPLRHTVRKSPGSRT